MLKLQVPPVLFATEQAPLQFSHSISARDVQASIEAINNSLIAINNALHRVRNIEAEELLLYDANGKVVSRFSNTFVDVSVEYRVSGTRVVKDRQLKPTAPASFPVTGAASGSYTATEQGLINTLITQINALNTYAVAITAVLTAHGLTT